jgi:glyoxylase-like metal-dependent hydrolase (beta-lactamase superfamily II)
MSAHLKTRRAPTAIESYICVTCGTQFAASSAPPDVCPICADDRQHIGVNGQEWTTHAQLAATYRNRIEHDGDLVGIGIDGRFGIPQRALLVPSSAGTIMWDCVSLASDSAIAALRERGGVAAIAISHPHFYSSMVEWSDALGGVPILLHEADRAWVQRTSPNIEWWNGDSLTLSDDVQLIHLPGHFPGSSALLWNAAPNGRRALLAGDSLHVADDRAHVTVMHSVPNYMPVGPHVIRDIQQRLTGVAFDDLYGYTWGRNLIGGADAAVARSLTRYLDIIDPSATAWCAAHDLQPA